MSRIGKLPITLPAKVDVKVIGDNISVKGPKGELSQKLVGGIKLNVDGSTLIVERLSESKHHRALHGLYRSLVNNMIIGVTQGFKKEQELVGVGYKAEMKGKNLALALGFSHAIVFRAPETVKIETPTQTSITIGGFDKQLVGLVAAKIRSFKLPEPYKGKGIKYEGEVLRRKAGKTAASSK